MALDATNATSISGDSIRGIGAPASDHAVVPGAVKRAEERDVSFIERVASGDLPAHL
jgi:hypothetical protein